MNFRGLCCSGKLSRLEMLKHQGVCSIDYIDCRYKWLVCNICICIVLAYPLWHCLSMFTYADYDIWCMEFTPNIFFTGNYTLALPGSLCILRFFILNQTIFNRFVHCVFQDFWTRSNRFQHHFRWHSLPAQQAARQRRAEEEELSRRVEEVGWIILGFWVTSMNPSMTSSFLHAQINDVTMNFVGASIINQHSSWKRIPSGYLT